MTRIKEFLTARLFTILLLVVSTAVTGQVTTNLVITPPYSPFFKDYVYDNKMLITVFSSTNRQVFMTASIKRDDNAVVIDVKDQYRPGIPVNLIANVPQTLSGVQLKNVYGGGTANDLVLQGITERELNYNQALPEGNYTICVRVKDFNTRQVLGEACRTIYVAYYEPPQIIKPLNNSVETAKNPQFLLTNWSPAAPGVQGVSYRVKLVKLINGINPVDALNNNVQVVIDKGNIRSTSFPIDVASGYKLDTGVAYAMQVIAESPKAFFKNGGRSEIVTFMYKGDKMNFVPTAYSYKYKEELRFIAPHSRKEDKPVNDTIAVNNVTPFNVSWNWFKIIPAFLKNNKDTIKLSDSAALKNGITKYSIEFLAATTPGLSPVSPGFNLSSIISTLNDTTMIKTSYTISMADADKKGFKDKHWYKAVVTGYGTNKTPVRDTSVNFMYLKVANEEDDTAFTSVTATVKYDFKGFPEQYNATNTPVVVEAFKKPVGLTSGSFLYIDKKPYVKIAYETATTDNEGVLHTTVPILKGLMGKDSIYYRIRVRNKYYIDSHFPLIAKPASDDDTTIVNFGQLTAKTYGYSLKVYVNKAFTSYKIGADNKITLAANPTNEEVVEDKNGYIYKSGLDSAKAGLDVVLFRKQKESYIPPVEGDIKAGSNKPSKGFVEVARGVTEIEKLNFGKEKAFVKFDKLLTNFTKGDEYYILVLKKDNYPGGKDNSNKQGSKSNSGNQQTAISSGNNISNLPVYSGYKDDNFEAAEQSFKLEMPNPAPADSLYRNATVKYNITSTKPPTSHIKGRLLYQWKSDATKQLRPVSNKNFTIKVRYDLSPQGVDFTPAGQDKPMPIPPDDGAVMAAGKTDEQGNFEIDVVNINKKGQIAKGSVKILEAPPVKPMQTPIAGGGIKTNPIDAIKDKVTDPGGNPWESHGNNPAHQQISNNAVTNMQATQGLINGGLIVTPTNTGFFETTPAPTNTTVITTPKVDMQTKGNGPAAPEPDDDEGNAKTVFATLDRNFELVVDDPYLQGTKTFVAQPFETKDLGDLICNVKEVKLIVQVKNKDGSPVSNVVVNVFRSLKDKKADLPVGEGDGKYLQAKLINPQSNGVAFNVSGFDYEQKEFLQENKEQSVFEKTFEYIWPSVDIPSDGKHEFPALLQGFNDYYVEVSSRPDQGTSTYKASFYHVHVNSNEADNTGVKITEKSEGGIPLTKVVSTLVPLPSRAFLRLQDDATKVAIQGTVSLQTWFKDFPRLTDPNGYVEFLANDTPLNLVVTNDNSKPTFKASSNGYKSETLSAPLRPTGSQLTNVFSLQPAGFVFGQVVSADENKKGVKAYIETPSGKIYETYDDEGHFAFQMATGSNITLIIRPKDVAYFDTSRSISFDANKTVYNFGNVPIEVFRRKHRFKFYVYDKESAALLDKATIELLNKPKVTTSKGIGEMSFENVSVTNYSFVIRGPKDSGYVPIILNLQNEESIYPDIKFVSLEKGSVIKGKVTLNGSAVKNAKVYIDANIFQEANGWNDGLVTAKTDNSGNYTLSGIPINNTNVDIVATIDTNFTVNGDRKKILIQNKAANDANLALIEYKGMTINNVYGFPLTVEKIIPGSKADEVKVTGIVHWTQAISKFTLDGINKDMRIENVVFKAVNKKGIAQDESISIPGVPSITLRYMNKYNVRLTKNSPQSNISNPLVISKDNNHGVIKAHVQIVDNSFNYPQSYLSFSDVKDNFFLADKIGNIRTNYFNAITSALDITQSAQDQYSSYNNFLTATQNAVQALSGALGQSTDKFAFNLTNSTGKAIGFKFLNFPATADPDKSYLSTKGIIHLNVDLACHIDNIKQPDFKVNLDEIVLDENKVAPAPGKSPITFKMETWDVKVADWKISPTEGGITSSNGLITTSKLDIPFSKFVLRNDMFLIEKFDVQKLSMAGGLITVGSIKSTNAGVVFDNKVGLDGGAHWRFSMSGTGGPIAKVKLPALSDSIGFNYVQILGNNDFIFQLDNKAPAVRINNNPLAKFTPSALTNNPDNLMITGSLNTGAPRLGDMTVDLNFKGANGATFNIDKVTTDIEAKGFVHFKSDTKNNISITSDSIKIIGFVQEFPKNSFGKIPATFSAVSNNNVGIYNIELQKEYPLGLGNSGNILTIKSGGIEVQGNDWTLLTYSGVMTGPPSVKPTTLNFKVLGDVGVDANGAKMDGIETPFGEMQMAFDFNTGILLGKINVVNVFLGPSKINGTVEVLFGLGGFYIAGGGAAEITAVNPFVDGTYNLGFLVGSYSIKQDVWQLVNAYKQPEVKNDCYYTVILPEDKKLAGFYFSIDRIIFDESHSFDFILASGYVAAKAIVGVDLWANFSSTSSVGLGVKVIARASAGLSAITGTTLEGEAHADAGINMVYNSPGGLLVKGSVDIGFKAKISQYLIATTVSAEKGIGCSAQAGTDGFNFTFTNGDKNPECFVKQ